MRYEFTSACLEKAFIFTNNNLANSFKKMTVAARYTIGPEIS